MSAKNQSHSKAHILPFLTSELLLSIMDAGFRRSELSWKESESNSYQCNLQAGERNMGIISVTSGVS